MIHPEGFIRLQELILLMHTKMHELNTKRNDFDYRLMRRNQFFLKDLIVPCQLDFPTHIFRKCHPKTLEARFELKYVPVPLSPLGEEFFTNRRPFYEEEEVTKGETLGGQSITTMNKKMLNRFLILVA